MKWISIEDRLPENDSDIIAFSKASGVVVSNYNYDSFGFYLYDLKDVTHWMPLPEPPEVD